MQVKNGKIHIKHGTRILEGAMCTEYFPAECKHENAGCALTLPNTIKTVFLEQCQHMHGRARSYHPAQQNSITLERENFPYRGNITLLC